MGQAASPACHCSLERSVCWAGEWGPLALLPVAPGVGKSAWVSICLGVPCLSPLPWCWSLWRFATSSKNWVCSSPGPIPSTPHTWAAIAREGRTKSEWTGSWCDPCPGIGGEEAGDVTTTPHTSSLLQMGPLSPRCVGGVEPSRTQALEKDRLEVCPWGRPDSRARRVGGGCVQHGARLLKSCNYTHLGIMPLSQVICMVG